MSSLRDRCAAAFGGDVRSLAALRIGVGVVLLADLALRAPDLRVFYTESGALPRASLADLAGRGWSLHALGEGPFLVALWFALAALGALSLIAGFRTRFAVALLWLLTVSLHNRNPLVTTGGDTLLRMLLVWGLFVPWNRRWALDAGALMLRARGAEEDTDWVADLGVAALMVQVFLVHVLAGLLKTGADWRSDFTALYYALSIDQLQLPLGGILLEAPWGVLRALTIAVVAAEVAIPPFLFGALFLPRRLWSWARGLAALALALFHVGLISTMALGIFPWVNLVSLLVFVPSGVWDRLPSASRGLDALARGLERTLPRLAALASRPLRRLSWPERVVVALILGYVVAYNFAPLAPVRIRLPREAVAVGARLRVNQEWDLFAPRPYRNDGWFVAAGHRAAGPAVDLLRGGAPVSLARPADVSAAFPNFRWRKFLWSLSLGANARHREPFLESLCRSWNRNQGVADQVRLVQLTFFREWTPPPGEAAEVTPISLGMHSCAQLSPSPSSTSTAQR